MNFKKILFGLLAVIASVFFFSCDDEPVAPQPTASVTTLECSLPSHITAERSTDPTMVTLLWQSNADQHSWQIQYGTYGFTLGSGTTVYSTDTSKIFIGLSETTGYDFYIRSACSESQFSEWVGPITVSPLGVILTGNYWPMVRQNQWVFSVDNINQQPWKIVSTDLIAGNTYYTFQEIDNEPAMRTRKTIDGDYLIKYDDYTDGLGNSVSGNETTVLKDYLNIGGSWTDTYVETITETGFPPESSNVEIVSTIIAQGATLTVPAGVFNDVIVVKRVKTVTAADSSVTTSTETYYFAKDHGPVQIKIEDENGDVTLKKLSAHLLY